MCLHETICFERKKNMFTCLKNEGGRKKDEHQTTYMNKRTRALGNNEIIKKIIDMTNDAHSNMNMDCMLFAFNSTRKMDFNLK